MSSSGPYLVVLLAPILFAQNGTTVEGRIADNASHVGVPGVTVTLWTQKGDLRYSATSDSSGSFHISDVQSGEYRSRYEKPGFLQLELPRFGEPMLRVGYGGSARVDVELTHFSTLSGRVLDPDGAPLAKAKVEIGPYTDAETDNDGRFTLTDLRPGTYTMRATVPAGSDSSLQRGPRSAIVPTYFPSATDQADAERIVLRGGAGLTGYDIRLRASPVFRLRGTVLDEAGKPARDANVRLLTSSPDQLLAGVGMIGTPVGSVHFFVNAHKPYAEEASIVSNADGTFEFPAVRPGNWELQATLDPQHDESGDIYVVSSSTTQVGVADHDVGNIELRFEPSFPLEVTFDWGDQKALGGNRLGDVELICVSDGRRLIASRGTKEGVARFGHVVAGRYRIVPGALQPSGLYLSAVLVGGRNALRQEVELTSDSAVHVVYKPNPGRVRGTVEQGEGAKVLLWPQDAEIPDTVLYVAAGPSGAFEFDNLSPGSYSVVAFDRVEPQNVSSSFLLSVIANAPRVQVEEAATVSLTLGLNDWPN